jgi:GNAT superfamily N-acetyltransferase
MSVTAELRCARARELDRLAELWIALAAGQGPGPRFRLRGSAEEGVRRHLAERLADPDALLLVADRAGDLPGLCVARLLRRQAIFAETERGEVEAIAVREDARREGLGRALAHAALGWLRERGAARVEVQVARGNASGRAFWSALGFAPAMDVLERHL